MLTFNKDLISAAQRKYTGMIMLNGEHVNTVNTVGGKKGGNDSVIDEGLSDKDNVSERENSAFSPPDAFTAFTPSQTSDKPEKKAYDYDDYKRELCFMKDIWHYMALFYVTVITYEQ